MPLYLRVANGNEADCVGFRQVVEEYRQQWQFDGLLVGDAALFTALESEAIARVEVD